MANQKSKILYFTVLMIFHSFKTNLQVHSIENVPLYFHFIKNGGSEQNLAFHGCSLSSVQSIIQYGLHGTPGVSSFSLFIDQ